MNECDELCDFSEESACVFDGFFNDNDEMMYVGILSAHDFP